MPNKMTNVYLDNLRICEVPSGSPVQDIYEAVHENLVLPIDDFYLHQHGRIVGRSAQLQHADSSVHVSLRLCGGKGGFGSMLRAIGAQIEKTTNREACRDLSGRRLRDINEEKRLKSWLDGQGARDEEVAERRKQKLARAQAVPKHVFEDKEYEAARQEMTQAVADSVEEGLRKAAEAAKAAKEAEVAAAEAGGSGEQASASGVKRKAAVGAKAKQAAKKKKKTALWLGGDFSSASDSSDDSEAEAEEKAQAKAKGGALKKQTSVAV